MPAQNYVNRFENHRRYAGGFLMREGWERLYGSVKQTGTSGHKCRGKMGAERQNHWR